MVLGGSGFAKSRLLGLYWRHITATDGIGIPNEKHLAQAKTTLPRTSPVYGRFDAPHCAKWLIYGIRFPKTRVSLLEFRHPYLENRS